jgi:hypothetical protein
MAMTERRNIEFGVEGGVMLQSNTCDNERRHEAVIPSIRR